MKYLKQCILSLALVTGMGVAALAPAASVSAVEVFDQCDNLQANAVCDGQNDSATNMIQVVINTALIVLGMVAVIVIVIGGIRYSTSGGNSTHVKEAKDTIIYAVVGLVVAIISYSIVNFVIDWF